MASLKDVITYNDKWFTELTSKHHRQEIEELAERLEPLRQEIGNHPKARINISDKGIITTHNLPEEVSSRLKDIGVLQ